MCPEGRLSVAGNNYGNTRETGKLLKLLKVPVVIANINGAYITNPKWRKHRIKGRVHTEVKYIITKEDIERLSVEEINDIIEENLTYNDFEYARKHKYKYKSKRKLVGAETVLYRCPKCHHEYELVSKGNTLTCSHCGFEVQANIHYSFAKNELGIRDFSHYYQMIEEYEEEYIKNNDFVLETSVKVKKFDFKNNKYGIHGEGTCRLTKEFFSFEGKVGDEEVSYQIPIKFLHALPFTANEEFECYYEEDLYYFYPKDNKLQCVKWALYVDILNKVGVKDE